MNKITFNLLSVAALTSISSLIFAPTRNVRKEIKHQPQRLVKVSVKSECWYVLLDAKLEKFAETQLSLIVPYVLERMPSQSRLCVDDKWYDRHYLSFGSRGRTYHQWIQQGNLLIYNRWTHGMVQKLNGKNYQCRDGFIVCEDDPEVVNGQSFQQY